MDNFSLLLKMNEAIHRTLDLDKRVYIILTCATAGCAFGFSRAFLLLKNEDSGMLEAHMGIGPVSQEDANRIWCQMEREKKTLEELFAEYEKIPGRESMPLYPVVKNLKISLSCKDDPVIRCLVDKKPCKVKVEEKIRYKMDESFIGVLGADEFVCVPLIVENEAVGILLADNLYAGRPITDESIDSLAFFANQMAVALEEARIHKRLMEKEERLREMEKQLRHAYVLASVGEMSLYLAHEIRNPLVAIGGIARSIVKLIEKNPSAVSKIKVKIKTILDEVKRLENLLSGILQYARPKEPVLQLADIVEVIEEVCHLLEREIAKRKIRLKKFINPLPYVRFDKDKIKQVFFNLFQNALDSMTQGGELIIRTEREKENVKIEITDTGSGIPAPDIDKIFAPFFTTKPSGLGLGLSIAREIVYQHAGSLKIESREGGGTSVFIYLPLSGE